MDNDERLELDIPDEDNCDPIYSATFTRYEIDYDEECRTHHELEDNSDAVPQEQEHEMESNSGSPCAVNDPMEYMSQNAEGVAGGSVMGDDSTATLPYLNVFTPIPRSRTTSATSASSSVTDLDEDAPSLVQPGAALSQPTIAPSAAATPKTVEGSDDCDKPGDHPMPKGLKKMATRKSTAVAEKRQVTRTTANPRKKHKVSEQASEVNETVRIGVRTRSGRQAGSRRMAKAH